MGSIVFLEMQIIAELHVTDTSLNQRIDFYVKDIDSYIQIDGVYWHGLNRPLSEIQMEKSSQDKKILRQIKRDNDLDTYMTTNRKNLKRITDEFTNSSSDQDILTRIKE